MTRENWSFRRSQLLQERRVGMEKAELYRVVVEGRDLWCSPAERRARACVELEEHVLERVDDVGRRERHAVVPTDIVTQVEPVEASTVLDLPALGQFGDGLE